MKTTLSLFIFILLTMETFAVSSKLGIKAYKNQNFVQVIVNSSSLNPLNLGSPALNIKFKADDEGYLHFKQNENEFKILASVLRRSGLSNFEWDKSDEKIFPSKVFFYSENQAILSDCMVTFRHYEWEGKDKNFFGEIYFYKHN